MNKYLINKIMYLLFTAVLLWSTGCEQKYEPNLSEPNVTENNNSTIHISRDLLIQYKWYPDNYIYSEHELFQFRNDGVFTVSESNLATHSGKWTLNGNSLQMVFDRPQEDYLDRMVFTIKGYSTKFNRIDAKSKVYIQNGNPWPEYSLQLIGSTL